MIGEKGSGKTSVLRRIGQLLFGPKFQVLGMSHEPKDFDAAVTGDAFVGIDNADANIAWLDDKLAVVATGGTLKRREYYTTNKLVEYPITAFVGITSRTPHFRREDVADPAVAASGGAAGLERKGATIWGHMALQTLSCSRSRSVCAVTHRLGRIARLLGDS